MTESREKAWITPDFEIRFREAMGRDMTDREREFFGLTDQSANRAAESASARNSSNNHSAQYAWQALRRISALLG